jgi:RHS repeat-associated protein
VVINGSGFRATAANNIVYFGATKAVVTAATTTQLTVIVPVGATYQPITVVTNGLIAYSKLVFSTTYPGWGVIDSNTFVSGPVDPNTFRSSTEFPTGWDSYFVTTGDFDNDGKVDLVSPNMIYNTVSILRNTSSGPGVASYAANVDFATGAYPNSVSAGDLNCDGKLDLVVANSDDNTISILRNTSTGAGSVKFAAKVNYNTGIYPTAVSIGDLDGDGKADLIVKNESMSPAFSVLRNTSTGASSVSFAAKIDFVMTGGMLSMGGDFDGDGKVDLVITNYNSHTVSVLRNTSTVGSISFASGIDYNTGTNPSSVSVGDLDGDGKVDLVVANYNSNTVSVLRNTSTGTGSVNFAAKVDYATTAGSYSVSIGDLDGDGKPDLALGNANKNMVSLLRNTSFGSGSINYASVADYATTGSYATKFVSIGDLDGDGKADLAMPNPANKTIFVMLHLKGARQTIASFNPFPLRTFGDAPISLNATASSALPVSYSSSNTSVATVFGNTVTIVGYGTTTITASQPGDNNYAPVSATQVLAVGPFPAIASFTPTSGPVGTSVTISGSGFNSTPANNIVYFGATKATVTASNASQLTVTVPVGATYQPITVLTNGLTAYSKLSFSTTYPGWEMIDAGSFVPKADFIIGAYPFAISNGDFDGDGKSDLAVSSSNNDGTSILRNIGDGNGSTNFAARVNLSCCGSQSSASIGDLDGDGKLDVALPIYNSDIVGAFRNTSIGSSVSFAQSGFYDLIRYSNPYAISIGDLDGDGKTDMAVANYANSTVSIFRNTSNPGTISFGARVDYTTIYDPQSVSIGDFDGDGKSDLVVANWGTVSILRNTSLAIASISFATAIDYTAASGSYPSVSIGDLDGDGKLDFAITDFDNNIVSIFRNTSTGIGSISFAAKVTYPTGTQPESVSIGDLDGDGRPDLAVANSGSNSLSILQNTSTGPGSISFAAKVDYVTGTRPTSVTIGDFNGDGKADLATANSGSSNISVILHIADQTIAFSSLPASFCYGDPTYTLNATASSGLPVTFSSNNSSVATINGNILTIVGAGTVTITASQVGNNIFRAAASVSQTITFNSLPTTFNLAQQTPYCQGTSGGVISLSGSENNVQYTLYYNGTALQPIAGNGSALTWSQLTQAGTYTVGALTALGCSSSMNGSVNINLIPLPPASIAGPSSIDDASITLTAPAGYNYTWSMTSGEVIQQSASPSLTVAAAGEYQVVVNSSGCTTTSAPHLVSATFTPNFNGNISVASWHTQAAYATGKSDYKGLYIYKYDEKSQLKEAQFAVPDFTTHTFVPAGNNFHETGYTYDPNGNIQTLKRYDGTGNKIHDLAYTYAANKNQLQSVSNNNNSFRDYHYNEIGQMSSQDNASGADQIVDYDVTGKVTDVYSDVDKTKKTTHYTYDDRGFRLSKETYDNLGHLKFTTWYIRDASGNVMSIYDQQANNPNISLTETPIYGSGKLGVYRTKPNGGGEYVYELTDHLGNVRATMKNETTVFIATMEDNGATDMTNPRVTENEFFKNLFETQQRDTRMNHTLSSAAVPAPNYLTVPDPGNTSYLNWTSGVSPQNIIGPGITLKVETGDQLNLEAWAKFQKNASYTRDATPAAMASLLGTTFVGTNGLESILQATQDFSNGIPMMLAGTSSDPGTKPFAYLNYLVFDKNFVFQDGGAARVPDAAGFDAGMEIAVHPQPVSFTDPIEIHQSGYIYVWVSNESENTKVWWDDLKVTLTGSRVTQATDYYPFGLVMREQTTANELEYRYKYQGQYAEKDDETGWEHFELREFDPIIARWTAVDPKGQFYSPYVGMGNNPVSGVDPDGGYLFGLFGSTRAQRQEARGLENLGMGYEVSCITCREVSYKWTSEWTREPGEGPASEFDTRQTDYRYTIGRDLKTSYVGSDDRWTTNLATGEVDFDPLTQFMLGVAARTASPLVVGLRAGAATAYSALSEGAFRMSTSIYIQSEILLTQGVRWASPKVFRSLLRIATPGSITMKAAIEANWLGKRPILNLQPAVMFVGKNSQSLIKKGLKLFD